MTFHVGLTPILVFLFSVSEARVRCFKTSGTGYQVTHVNYKAIESTLNRLTPLVLAPLML